MSCTKSAEEPTFRECRSTVNMIDEGACGERNDTHRSQKQEVKEVIEVVSFGYYLTQNMGPSTYLQ